MAAIKFMDSGDREFASHPRPGATDAVLSCRHHPGSDHAPQLDEYRFPPRYKVAAHAHEADQIMFVAQGSVRFGNHECGAGSSVFVPGMTLYSFESGPEGLTLLTFVPVQDTGAIWKDDFMALRNKNAD